MGSQSGPQGLRGEKLGWEIGYSDFVVGGKLDYRDVIEPIYEEASKAVGRDLEYPENE